MKEGINVLSLFDGMSCGQIALKKAKINFKKYFASEIKKMGIKVTQYNSPNTVQIGSVTEVEGKNLPKIDLLIGGSPCQNLSLAMAKEHRKGLNGDKSSLFYEYYRILQEVKPTYFLLENVGGMPKDDENVITELLGVRTIRINSKLVSCQLRNRMYWTNIPGVKQPKNLGIQLNDILENGWSDREKARCLLESDSRPLTTPLKMFHRYHSTGFNTLIFKSKEHYLKCKEHYESNFKKDKKVESGTRPYLSAKEIDQKLKGEKIKCGVYDGVRYLSQNELEICQTVPVGYTNVLNRNDAAGLLGDGWTVDVIAHILSYLPDEWKIETN